MRETDEIKKRMIDMLNQKDSVFQGTVIEVNEEKFTCTILVEERIYYYNVRLKSVINPELNGIVLIPAIGSYILAGRIGKSNELFVYLFSEIDKVLFCNEHLTFTLDNDTVIVEVKGTTIDITENGITIQNQENKISARLAENEMNLAINGNYIDIAESAIIFNKGNNGGLVKIKELTNRLNELISIFRGHTHTIGTGEITFALGSFTGVNIDPLDIYPTTNICKDFTREDYENINIKH